jgi:hypothetical protein
MKVVVNMFNPRSKLSLGWAWNATLEVNEMRIRHLALALGAVLVSIGAYAAVKSITADSSEFSDFTDQYRTW